MTKMNDATTKKVMKWIKITSIVSGSLGTILTPILVMYIEFAPKVRAARGEAGIGYETLEPAVNELKEIQSKGIDWAVETDEDIETLKDRVISQEKRIARLEKYIKDLSIKRRFPAPPKPVAMMGKGAPKDFDEDGIDDSEEPEDIYLEQRPQHVVPVGIDDAKKFQKARDKQKCPPSDPLCGTEAL